MNNDVGNASKETKAAVMHMDKYTTVCGGIFWQTYVITFSCQVFGTSVTCTSAVTTSGLRYLHLHFKYCRFTEYYYFGHIFSYIGFLFTNPVQQELQALKFSNDLLACTRGESVNLIQGFCLFLISYHASMPLTP